MKAHSWRIPGAVLLLAVVISAAVFWPTQREETGNNLAGRQKPSAEELYKTALLHKEPGDSPARNYRIVVDCCRQILEEYPDSPEAEKARAAKQAY